MKIDERDPGVASRHVGTYPPAILSHAFGVKNNPVATAPGTDLMPRRLMLSHPHPTSPRGRGEEMI